MYNDLETRKCGINSQPIDVAAPGWSFATLFNLPCFVRSKRGQSPRRSTRIFLLLGVVGLSHTAHAHHGAMGSLGRNSGSLSSRRAQPNTQALGSVTTARVRANGALTQLTRLELGAEYAFSQRVSISALSQAVQIKRTAESADYGIGGSEVGGKWLLNAPLKKNPTNLLLMGTLSPPSHTVTLGLDPGPIWQARLGSLYSKTRGDWLWQAQLGIGGDARRAGLAANVDALASATYWVSPNWGAGLGLFGQSRVRTWCTQAGTTQACRTGRATEVRTPTYQPALAAQGAIESLITDSYGLRASFEVPVTSRRNSLWSLSLAAVIGL